VEIPNEGGNEKRGINSHRPKLQEKGGILIYSEVTIHIS
jgi:hypothetical protein